MQVRLVDHLEEDDGLASVRLEPLRASPEASDSLSSPRTRISYTVMPSVVPAELTQSSMSEWGAERECRAP